MGYDGTMTRPFLCYIVLISLLFAGVDKQDPRVQSAYDWILANYTLDENPGAKDRSGLYYYYTVFAKAMAAYDEDEAFQFELGRTF